MEFCKNNIIVLLCLEWITQAQAEGKKNSYKIAEITQPTLAGTGHQRLTAPLNPFNVRESNISQLRDIILHTDLCRQKASFDLRWPTLRNLKLIYNV